MLPRLPTLPGQCYSGELGTGNLGSVGSNKDIQPNRYVPIYSLSGTILTHAFGEKTSEHKRGLINIARCHCSILVDMARYAGNIT